MHSATIMRWLAVTLLGLTLPVLAQAQMKALTGGTLIDGYGAPPIRNSVIVINGDRIQAIGTTASLFVPDDYEKISTEGMTVLPGLWEMHAHLMLVGHSDYSHWHSKYPPLFERVIMPAAAEQLLMAGVTSARDLGAPLEASVNVKERIARADIPGPTLYISGPFLQHEPYPGTELYRWGVSGVRDARAKVQKLAEAGVDVVKLIDQDQMTMEEVHAIVDEAHNRGLKVVAHAHRPEEIRRGLAAGIDNFEHTGLATAPEFPPDVIAALRERTAQMNLGPLYWTPTIRGLANYEYIRDNPEMLDDPAWQRGLPEIVVADVRTSLEHYDRLAYFQITPLRSPTLQRKIDQLRESGVVLLVGTDSGIPGNFHSQSTWQELDAWVNHFGVDAMTTIRGATYWPAVMMGVDRDYGTISEGKYADIIAVRGDPLRHIDVLRDPQIILKHGRRYK